MQGGYPGYPPQQHPGYTQQYAAPPGHPGSYNVSLLWFHARARLPIQPAFRGGASAPRLPVAQIPHVCVGAAGAGGPRRGRRGAWPAGAARYAPAGTNSEKYPLQALHSKQTRALTFQNFGAAPAAAAPGTASAVAPDPSAETPWIRRVSQGRSPHSPPPDGPRPRHP
jgi:hypothetical protein